MKHIIIAGASRCGKTTLSMKLAKVGFVHYKMDSIKRGIDRNFWEGYKDNWRLVSPHMAHLIATMISDSYTDIVKDKEYYVIDTCHLYPSDLASYDLKDTIVVFLGYDHINLDEKLNSIRRHDSVSYTNFLTDEEINLNTRYGIAYSIDTKKECEKFGYKYFDTSDDFVKTLESVYEYIEDELDEKSIKKV